MKFVQSALAAVVLLSPLSSFAEVPAGMAKFQQLCASCHVMQGQATIAPPVYGMRNHLNDITDKDEFVQHIIDWVKAPSAEKARMKGAIKKFGLMPALPYPEEDVRLVAEWLFEAKIDKPNWYDEHYRAEHGEAPSN
ncbi:MAG: hypothetical protein HWE20_00075 [Gammaproteobacteria bacterium]|nr:hypothetical protein [Gammaproteobacteria bacterium]